MGARTPYPPPPSTSTTSTPKGLYRFTIQYNKQVLLHVRLEESFTTNPQPFAPLGVRGVGVGGLKGGGGGQLTLQLFAIVK